jgi:hypothetical protein
MPLILKNVFLFFSVDEIIVKQLLMKCNVKLFV